MYILGISAFYHDSAACLFRNNTLLGAAEEERFTGIKGDSSFPLKTIKWLFRSNGISIDDISVICWYENPDLKKERIIENFKKHPIKNLPRIIRWIFNKDAQFDLKNFLREEIGFNNTLKVVDHHLSHASFSFFTSDFDDSNILTVDGVGEKETLTISKARGNKISKLHSVNYPNSLGLFYSAFTAFLGFKPNEGEYKLMGLAAYGDSNVFYNKLKSLIDFNSGDLKINMRYFSWHVSEKTMFNENLLEHLGMHPRIPGDPILKEHKDLAAAVQKIYEDIFLEFVNFSFSLNPSENLCLGGGCAYNGLANGLIKSRSEYKRTWIPFSPSDGGSAIGACLFYINIIRRQKRKGPLSPYQGPDFNEHRILSSIQKFDNIDFVKMETSDLVNDVAKKLADGNVIGWFQGRMEFGSRALGNRSIIASPLIKDMQDRINLVIKKRETFRPFAPSVIEESADKFFDVPGYVPYMNMVVRVKPEWDLPAITHIDGTARVQTVNRHDNPRYYHLIKKFGELTGIPVILNTSFNFKDQTITLYPEDAIIRFLDSEMNYLVLGNFLISKK
jgi:carbamoyltransferase